VEVFQSLLTFHFDASTLLSINSSSLILRAEGPELVGWVELLT